MYKLSIPITGGTFGEQREKVTRELLRAKADRVFLCLGRSIKPEDVKRQALEKLPEEIAYFRSLGLEVGVWISSLGHGGSLSRQMPYQKIIDADGSSSDDSFCPLDEQFTEELCRYVADIGRTEPDIIMLDDDYRLSARSGGIGCFCPLHLKRISEIYGKPVTREDILRDGLSGEANALRSAWMQVNGELLLQLAKRLRSALNETAPHVRLGHCAVMSTWDVDGVDSITLAKAFAGDTKPFLRLIGAPYWSVTWSNMALANVIEQERMQLTWCENSGLEVFTEGDVYPRPRHTVPAAVLEGFDTALRADGRADGILKYMIDYKCKADYETGYVERHVRHMPLYKEIERLFCGTTPTGVRVYDSMNRLEQADLSPFKNGGEIMDGFFNAGIRFLCDLSVPMQYTQPDVTVIFGENARHVPAEYLQQGAVLDGVAARILTERGFDVGVQSVEGTAGVKAEYDPQADVLVEFRSGMSGAEGAPCVAIVPKPSAEVVTEFRGQKTLVSYHYENSQGQRFLVYPFDAQRVRFVSMLFRCYYKQHQLQRSLAWIRRKPMDVFVPGHPDLYVQTARSEGALAVGLWNFFLDEALEPEIQLGEGWSRAEFVGCSGELCGRKLKLSTIPPYGLAMIKLYK